jgi:hypothetical protein
MKRLLLENQETTRMPKEAAELAMSMCQEKTSIQEGKFLLFWDKLERDVENFEKAIDLFNQALLKTLQSQT